jgi:HSP20 family protein
LRDVLDDLDRHFDEFEKSLEEIIRSSVNAGQKAFSPPVVAGMAMGVGPEGKPSIQFFGDNMTGPNGYRAPIYEQILDQSAGTLRLMVELPGVDKEDLEISAQENRVSLSAVHGERKYKVDITPKKEIEPDSGSASYKNGVLEAVFKIKDNTNKGYRQIRVV